MANYDAIKKMTIDEMAELLTFCGTSITSVPGCEKGCEDFSPGCAMGCPKDKQCRAVRKWLEEEY